MCCADCHMQRIGSFLQPSLKDMGIVLRRPEKLFRRMVEGSLRPKTIGKNVEADDIAQCSCGGYWQLPKVAASG